ncbi:uncharacterized protein LOC124167877 [Ischnura elegans]|uniref:uncharacterized protein LOC124167877 n=1 Tax=Ischnura elegans TaxID=197161 RepID=UPI001ED88E55|nr:uncharacterized protein LOC124167877 [Ischnura elegans]XP_046401891.1 uncharacterized protein LOC124167877 [Ischnura elegans]
MNVEGDVSSESSSGKAPMKIYASVYVHEKDGEKSDNIDDTWRVVKLLEDLNCKIINDEDSPPDESEEDREAEECSSMSDDTSDDEDSKPKPNTHHEAVIINQMTKDTLHSLESLASKNPDAGCFILYIFARQIGNKLKTSDNNDVDVFQLWKAINKPTIPTIFFVQGNSENDADEVPDILLNSENATDRNKNTITSVTTIPKSANVLLVYLPKPENLNVSVPEILREELLKNLEIHTSLINVNRMLREKGCKSSPKFSSTVIEDLHLTNGEPAALPEKYSCERNFLAYAFLFGTYSPGLDLDNLDEDVPLDKKSLRVLEEEFGVKLEFCVENHLMKKADFEKKLLEILQNEELDSCDGIIIILSTHGMENLCLFAYDGCFTIDYVWHSLANSTKLKNKPKVIISDACRGPRYNLEGAVPFPGKNSKGGSSKAVPFRPSGRDTAGTPSMDDMLVALASVEGKPSYGGMGSIFISNLCHTLRKHGELDFQTILRRTMEKVSLIETQYKQQVTFTSALQKLLYLPKKNCQ